MSAAMQYSKPPLMLSGSSPFQKPGAGKLVATVSSPSLVSWTSPSSPLATVMSQSPKLPPLHPRRCRCCCRRCRRRTRRPRTRARTPKHLLRACALENSSGVWGPGEHRRRAWSARFFEERDVQRGGAVHAERDDLLDVARPARAGDQDEVARQAPGRAQRAQHRGSSRARAGWQEAHRDARAARGSPCARRRPRTPARPCRWSPGHMTRSVTPRSARAAASIDSGSTSTASARSSLGDRRRFGLGRAPPRAAPDSARRARRRARAVPGCHRCGAPRRCTAFAARSNEPGRSCGSRQMRPHLGDGRRHGRHRVRGVRRRRRRRAAA